MEKKSKGRRYKGLMKEISAGGVVFRRVKGEIKFLLLLKTNKKKLWVLPKGKIDSSESPAQAALREVEEETGLGDLRIIAPLGKEHYYYLSYEKKDMLVAKTVYYFLMENKKGKPCPQKEEGFLKAKWFLLPEALKKIAYYGSRKILKKASLLIRSKK